MSFNDFLNQAWSEHATQTLKVAHRLEEGIKLIENSDQIPSMSQLITHVMGEHLGLWIKGIQLVKQLSTVPSFIPGSESDKAIVRAIAILELAGGTRKLAEELSTSDQIRVLAVAASALSQQNESVRAQRLFREALDKAQLGVNKDDPANRALAVTGNNLACSIEEKSSLSQSETELMILAAQTGRKYWEIAGSWLEVERAEYRLSRSYLKANDTAMALTHAEACIEISQRNDAPALELFFGYEALALAEKARQNKVGFSKAADQAKYFFEKLEAKDKSWCEAKLSILALNG